MGTCNISNDIQGAGGRTWIFCVCFGPCLSRKLLKVTQY